MLSVVFFLLTGLTHFGTFVFALFFLFLTIVYFFRKKALLPLTVVIAVSIGIVAFFDTFRFQRLLSSLSLVFEKPALLNGMLAPPDILIILISVALAIIGIVILRTKNGELLSHQKTVLFSCIVCLLALSFPMLDGEYFQRLNLFLFIPQILLILQISSVINTKQLKAFSIT